MAEPAVTLGGYVGPDEAAGELLDEAVEPFVNDMKRYLKMGLEDQARQFCQGILLGLYRVRDGGENDILGWAPDFPGEAAANALEVWSETGGTEREGAHGKKRRRRFSPDFLREHMPDLRRSREMTLLCSPKVTQHHANLVTP